MWLNFYVNKNMIQHETAKAVLVKLPKTDWLVWISSKCVRTGTHAANLQIGVCDDRQYEIFRNGKGRYNRFDKIDSKTVTGAELAEMCGVEAIAPKPIEYHKPATIEPVYNQQADNELVFEG